MIKKKILNSSRVRSIKGGFSFIPHRFLTGGFWSELGPEELLLYFFLILAGDRNGLSFYSYDKICTLLGIRLDQYIQARDGLMEKDLIAFDGNIYQVLSLPVKSTPASAEKQSPRKIIQSESVGKTLNKILMGVNNG
ncbi:MAG: hypothetical protein RBR67_19505 [Desulfobacterium sp.]|jgi:hypothetical protein|nr:hypothetical protein [Desulfobacterium sp.]MDY0376230.1 hypothetical protein [Desulfobacterium sp.]